MLTLHWMRISAGVELRRELLALQTLTVSIDTRTEMERRVVETRSPIWNHQALKLGLCLSRSKTTWKPHAKKTTAFWRNCRLPGMSVIGWRRRADRWQTAASPRKFFYSSAYMLSTPCHPSSQVCALRLPMPLARKDLARISQPAASTNVS